MNRPLVSVITPCFNGEKFVHRLFDSLLAQTYKHLEIIFVNDGSTDRTEQIIQSYIPEFNKQGMTFIYLKQENKGQAAALNNGLKYFTGDYLVWPDSDDYLSNDSIELKVLFLENNQEYGFVRSNGCFVTDDQSNKFLRRVSEDPNRKEKHIFPLLIKDETFCCCGCYMLRKNTFLSIYPDREIFLSRGGQNWQMEVPVSYNFKCGFIDKDLYYITEREGSHSRIIRDYKDSLSREEELEKILLCCLDVTRLPENEYRKYYNIIRSRYIKNRMILALRNLDSDRIKCELKQLKEIEDFSNVYKYLVLIVSKGIFTRIILFMQKWRARVNVKIRRF